MVSKQNERQLFTHLMSQTENKKNFDREQRSPIVIAMLVLRWTDIAITMNPRFLFAGIYVCCNKLWDKSSVNEYIHENTCLKMAVYLCIIARQPLSVNCLAVFPLSGANWLSVSLSRLFIWQWQAALVLCSLEQCAQLPGPRLARLKPRLLACQSHASAIHRGRGINNRSSAWQMNGPVSHARAK